MQVSIQNMALGLIYIRSSAMQYCQYYNLILSFSLQLFFSILSKSDSLQRIFPANCVQGIIPLSRQSCRVRGLIYSRSIPIREEKFASKEQIAYLCHFHNPFFYTSQCRGDQLYLICLHVQMQGNEHVAYITPAQRYFAHNAFYEPFLREFERDLGLRHMLFVLYVSLRRAFAQPL